MSIDENSGQGEGIDKRIVRLHKSIQHAFPPETYLGNITPYDEEFSSELREEQAAIDEEWALYQGLKARKWTDVSKSLMVALPDGFALLTNEAFVAFLAAWLTYSLENMDVENEVRNFLVYVFEHPPSQFQSLNRDQRHVVRSLLVEFAQRGTVPFVSEIASKAVALIDTLK